MLKPFIGLLLLVNLGLYGYNAGYLGNGSLEGREPARVTNQINADRIRRIDTAPVLPSGAIDAAGVAVAARSVSVGPVAATTPPGSPGPGTPANAVVTVAANDSSDSSTPAMPAPSAVQALAGSNGAACMEVGNFDAAEARRFNTLLAPLALGERLSRRSVQELERHIVYIPPASDKEGAERKAAELRRLGIDDFYIIQDNTNLRWGISLGMFKTVDAARLHLANLAQKGVGTAKVAARPGNSAKTAFQLRGLDAAGRSTLEKIRLGFPRQDTRACAPA